MLYVNKMTNSSSEHIFCVDIFEHLFAFFIETLDCFILLVCVKPSGQTFYHRFNSKEHCFAKVIIKYGKI